uniref:Ovule protein n=1 Tax=Brugia timori TaxID=42155 RepID=A0A0R3R4N9_9BILA
MNSTRKKTMKDEGTRSNDQDKNIVRDSYDNTKNTPSLRVGNFYLPPPQKQPPPQSLPYPPFLHNIFCGWPISQTHST